MPGAKRYRLTPRAREDLEEIWLYSLTTWSLDQADRYHAKLVQAFEDLANATRRGRDIGHVRPGYFKLASGSHFIFYRESEAAIDIIRILHQQMDVERHL